MARYSSTGRSASPPFASDTFWEGNVMGGPAGQLPGAAPFYSRADKHTHAGHNRIDEGEPTGRDAKFHCVQIFHITRANVGSVGIDAPQFHDATDRGEHQNDQREYLT